MYPKLSKLGGNLLVRNFFSNLVIVLILLLIISQLIYSNFIQLNIKIVKDEKDREMQIAVSDFSQKLIELDSIGLSILTNNKLSPYAIDRGGYSGMVATGEITKYQVGNSFIESILLYTFHNGRYLLTSSTSICDPDIALSLKYGYSASSKKLIDNILSNTRESFLFSSCHIMESTLDSIDRFYPQKRLFYIIPSSMRSRISNSSVIFLINESTIQAFLKKILSNYNGYIYLFDNQGDLISSAQGNEVSTDSHTILSNLNNQSDNLNHQTFDLDNVSYTIFHQYIENHELSFLMVIPTSQYLEAINRWMNSLTALLLIAIVIGLLISSLITLTNYSPIYRLTDLFKRLLNYEKSTIGRELPYISTAFNDLFIQNNCLQEEIRKLSVIHRQNILLNMFYGHYSETEILSQANVADMKIDKPFFSVLYLNIDYYHQFKNEHSYKMRYVLKKCILTRCEEVLDSIGTPYGTELRDPDALAILFNAEHVDAINDKLVSHMRTLISYFIDNFELSLTIGISPVYFDLKYTATAFREAQIASEFRLIQGTSKVIMYNNVSMKPKNRCWYPSALEQELLDAIKLVETSKISKVLNRLIQECRNQVLSIPEVKFICFGIVGAISRFLSSMEVEPHVEFYKLQAILIEFQFETLSELQSNLEKLAIWACKYITIKFSDDKSRLLNDLFEFISENYNDSSLCLESIAQHFNYSTSYISRFFKKHTGNTLIKYIDNLRIKHAKQLLRETSYSLSDILVLVGYNDKTNFIRKFKRIENITPIQYRTAYQSKIVNILDFDMC